MLRISDPAALADAFPAAGSLPPLRGVLLIRPDGFRLSAQAAADNRYMATDPPDPAVALAEHDAVVQALRDRGIAVTVLEGDPALPDACFPNNAIATLPGGTVVYGRLRHPDRQGEATRPLVRQALADLGYTQTLDWSAEAEAVCELTGSLVIDHARRFGVAGKSERLTPAGVDLIAAHWDLDVLCEVDLAPGEYHTNVVLALLNGRGCVIAPQGFADPAAADALIACYAPHVLILTPEQQAAFAGNILALGDSWVAMSQTAAVALGDAGLATLTSWGLEPIVIPIPELEKGGGSMRCLLCELW